MHGRIALFLFVAACLCHRAHEEAGRRMVRFRGNGIMNEATESAVWHPFTQHGLGEPIPLIERAAGARLYDAQGNSWIDAISSWWVTTHGHAHPRIMAAIRSEEHTSELQSLMRISYAVFCLKTKKTTNINKHKRKKTTNQ